MFWLAPLLVCIKLLCACKKTLSWLQHNTSVAFFCLVHFYKEMEKFLKIAWKYHSSNQILSCITLSFFPNCLLSFVCMLIWHQADHSKYPSNLLKVQGFNFNKKWNFLFFFKLNWFIYIAKAFFFPCTILIFHVTLFANLETFIITKLGPISPKSMHILSC